MSEQGCAVILVQSTSHAIRAEVVLHQAGIRAKLIPVPRHLSSDCGVCLRVMRSEVEPARQVLEKNRIKIERIHEI